MQSAGVKWRTMTASFRYKIVFLLGLKEKRDDVEILQLLLQNFRTRTRGSLLKAATKEEISGNSEANGRTLMKKVIVACGNGVATSQTVAFSYQSHAGKREHHQCQGGGSEPAFFTKRAHGALAYIDITNSHMDYGIPTVNGLAFLSGEHKEEAFQELIKIIKNR